MNGRHEKANAPGEGGAVFDRVGGLESINENKLCGQKFNTSSQIRSSKSTATAAQLARLVALLRQGPKTTIDLRSHAIMMPAARVFQLKHEHGYNIKTELVALYDTEGVRHRKCARYHLVESQSGEGA